MTDCPSCRRAGPCRPLPPCPLLLPALRPRTRLCYNPGAGAAFWDGTGEHTHAMGFSKQRGVLRAAQAVCFLGIELFQNPDLSTPDQDLLSPLQLLLALPSACQHQDGQEPFSPFCRPGDRELKAAATLATLNPNVLITASRQDAASGHLQAESVITWQIRRETLTWVQNLSGGSPQVIPAGSTRTVT